MCNNHSVPLVVKVCLGRQAESPYALSCQAAEHGCLDEPCREHQTSSKIPLVSCRAVQCSTMENMRWKGISAAMPYNKRAWYLHRDLGISDLL